MTDLFREVDDALQKDKLLKIWEQFGSWIIGGVIALIVIVAVQSSWTSFKHYRQTKQTAILISALDSEKPEEKMAEAIDDLSGGHEAAAQMITAGNFADKGNIDKALPLYQSVFENSSAPEKLQGLARILYVRHAQEISKDKATDAKKWAEILYLLVKDDGHAWTWMARLDFAVITAHELKDPAKALEILATFDKGKNIPNTMKDKAAALTQVYAARQGKGE